MMVLKMIAKLFSFTLEFVIIFFVLIISCNNKENLDLEGMEQVSTVLLPSEAPDDWLLAHIDVETTGLIPGYHEMIDIGMVLTFLDGQIIDSLFIRIQPQFPERLSQKAFEINAFNHKKWKKLDALSPIAAVDSIIAFHEKNVKDKQVLMVAYNSQFDTAFLNHLFRTAKKTWRSLFYYYVLDIPSMAWGLGFKDLNSNELMARYNIKDEPHIAEQHTGITGALKNVEIYKAILRYRSEIDK